MIDLRHYVLSLILMSLLFISCAQDTRDITWEQVNSGSSAHLYGVSFLDGKNIWVVGSGGIVLSSEDGGKSWSGNDERSIATYTLTHVNFTTPINGWIVGRGNIHYTGSAGKSWSIQHQIRSTSNITPGILDLYFINTTEGWAVGGVDGIGMSTILYTQNGGGSWERVNNPSDKHLWGVHAYESSVWVVGEKGEILHSPNGGQQWTRQLSKAEQPLFAVHFPHPSKGWIVGSDGLILHTTDQGINWKRQTNPMKQSLRDVHFQDEERGWAVGEEGVILHTQNGGKTWKNYLSPTTKNLQDIHFNGNIGWIVGEKGVILRTK